MAIRRIGQILVDLGFITDEQLEALLEEQQQHPGQLLGKLAESQGLINEEQLSQALAEQWSMQVIHLGDTVVPPNVLGLVTDTMAQMYRIIPISFRDNTLTIALCDPQNLAIQDELRTFLGYEIRAVVATERDILKALDRYYASSESVESLVQDMDSDTELAAAANALDRDGPIDLTSVEALADSAPVRKLLNMVLLLAIKDHASDLHF
ncbi:MAG: pilus assembly protein PilB, partial [Pirellulales bacterium]